MLSNFCRGFLGGTNFDRGVLGRYFSSPGWRWPGLLDRVLKVKGQSEQNEPCGTPRYVRYTYKTYIDNSHIISK